jgi:hypothetical protein
MMVPLASFTPLVAKKIWTLINVGVLFLLVLLIQKITDWKLEYCGLMVLLTGFNLINNFYLGQFYLILTYLIFLAFYLEREEKEVWAGLVFSLGILFKYFPIIYLLGYLLEGKKKVVALTMLSVALVGFLMLYFIGFSIVPLFLNEVLIPHLNGSIAGQPSNSVAFQSFNSLYLNLFSSTSLVRAFTGTTYMLVVLMTGYIIVKIKRRKWHFNYILSVLGFAALMILPASASYHFVLLLFPTVLFLVQFQKDNSKWNPVILIILFSGVGLFNISFTHAFWDSKMGILKVLSFPRLGLVTLLFSYVMWELIKMKNIVKPNNQ